MVPAKSKWTSGERRFTLLPLARKGGASRIFRDFLRFFNNFYLVICLSSPSILVVYDTDNKLSLLRPDLLLSFSTPSPYAPAATLLGPAPRGPRTPTRLSHLGRGQKQMHFSRKEKPLRKRGQSYPKSLPVPPKYCRPRVSARPFGKRPSPGMFWWKMRRVSSQNRIYINFSLIFRVSNVFRSRCCRCRCHNIHSTREEEEEEENFSNFPDPE